MEFTSLQYLFMILFFNLKKSRTLSIHSLLKLICNLVLVLGVQQVVQLYLCIHTVFRFFSIIGYYKILNTVPCAIQ